MKQLTPTLVLLALAGCNQPPAGGLLLITPQLPTAQDDLVADLVEPIKDENDDVVSLRWVWYLHGNVEPAHTTDTVPSAVTRKGQVWRVEITPNDGKVDGVKLFAETIILNSPPVATVTLAPLSPLSDQDLVATVQITDLDDDDTSASRITWSVDGAAMDLPGTTVSSSMTKRGETWRIEVAPKDDEDEGEVVSAEVVIANVKPAADSVVLQPSEAYEGTRLLAVATGSDYDDDELTWTYTWYVNGGEIKSGVEDWFDGADFDKDEAVIVEATANDGFEDSNTVTSSSVVILNSPPALVGARLDPATATEETTIGCVVDGPSDPDGDTVQFRYAWTVDRRDVGVSIKSLDGTNFSKGQQVVCTVTPNDGTIDGEPVSTGFVTIGNTPPSLTSASISPASPRTDDTLTAAASGLVDIDGDRVTLSTEWFVNGSSVSKGSTLGGTAFKKGDKVEVALTPYDGDDFGSSVRSKAVIIGNTAPVIASIRLSPDPAYTTTPITASVVATDADSDRLTYSYTWFINGVKGSTSATLGSGSIKKNDKVYVDVVASDGTDSTKKTSLVRTIDNSAPSTPSTPGLSPATPKASENLVCSTSGSTDADRDRLTYSYAWYRDGRLYGTYTSTSRSYSLAASNTASGQRWYCRVRASDGTATSSWSVNSATRTISVGSGDGQVRTVSGTWFPVTYEKCGSGASCNSVQAKAACARVRAKVVSHASNGTSSVYSLGATKSCQWSTSYFKVNKTMGSGDCLVGISNLDWSSCCTTSRWHGNTLKFGAAGAIFGYVNSGNSGYVASYKNGRGTTWGCTSLTTSASNNACSAMYVACKK